MSGDGWSGGDRYEAYVGRWSRLVAAEFVRWLAMPPGLSWVDVGCGTGALTAAILRDASPARVVGVEPSESFLSLARERVPGAAFVTGRGEALPLGDASAGVVVSGLSLNFVPDPLAAVAEARRAGRTAAAYVWDYAEGMQMMRHFWDAAAAVDPGAPDEGARFPICAPETLGEAFGGEVTEIVVPTVFRDFDDYWTPFTGGTGAAPAYLARLDPARRDAIRDDLRQRLPAGPDGSIALTARAWAARTA